MRTKLTSRKLWVGVALVIIGIVMCIMGDTTHGVEIICIGGGGYLGCELICDVVRQVWKYNETETDTGTETSDTAE